MYMKRMTTFAAIGLLVLASCSKSKDLYDPNISSGDKPEPEIKVEANTFDFSTTQSVNLAVDYSASKAGSVFFSIYAENPMTDDDDPALKENVLPVFESFTDASGKFNFSVSLPAYAKHLYVYTGNFFVSDKLIECDVVNGSAIATVSASRAATRGAYAMTRGAQTNSLETLAQLYSTVDWKDGSVVKQVYKPWHTPLGTWDDETGRPNYLMKSTDKDYEDMSFSADELTGIKNTISVALTNKKSCPQNYRLAYDLYLTQDSKVAVTVIGSNTCWNNTVGYYYYTGDVPTKENLNIIMLFPNTQDGKSDFIKSKGNKYDGNIALNLNREQDVVLLKYYPNIASGSYADETPIFPAGTKIGFILKTNGWGMQASKGSKNYYNSSYKGANSTPGYNLGRQYNSWATTTDGLSYCEVDQSLEDVDNGTYAKPNPEGKARTAKFAYKNAQGQQYAIVSFEDACNDDDFDDFIIAMKPVGVFNKIPEPGEKITSEYGVYGFEDLWPDKGDYDLNDAVIDYRRDFTWKAPDASISNPDYKIYKETINLTTYLNYVTLTSGLAVTVKTKSGVKSVTMKTSKNNQEESANFTKDGDTYLLTSDIKGNQGTTYILEIEYNDRIATDKTADVKAFIYRDETSKVEGETRWEVHIPFEAPTSKVIKSYFGTKDDLSNLDAKKYYVREGNYPFAFFLSGVTVESFKNTILLRDNESKTIDSLYPDFIGWSTSGGKENTDWYLK